MEVSQQVIKTFNVMNRHKCFLTAANNAAKFKIRLPANVAHLFFLVKKITVVVIDQVQDMRQITLITAKHYCTQSQPTVHYANLVQAF
jgi:hypothetical protein